MRKNVILIIVSLLLVKCSSTQTKEKTFNERLNFSKCLLEEKSFDYIETKLSKGYSIKKINLKGFCEYRFVYKDSSIFYVSSNIYNGSRLNYDNLFSIGINGYNKRNTISSDIIKNEGVNKNLYWLEFILGDYVVGYVGVKEERKNEFNEMVKNVIVLKKKG
ncbi:hypothetical protein [Flavobacterium solisilvae]|uniref:Lipoprotein n=1 Tax=Flavobacterium solisilvae TaxID=1852019 RepID=A0ABX1QTW2_9FLAO|nr:hypothetical protein [Flavobacterium solisilvae]NMH24465.1 hypothetical protein [Flavobacterium solisilvae]